MPLRFLHISDIHFRKYDSLKKQLLDLDENIQNEVELDLTTFYEANGAIDAILIGGDIAFSGRVEEYEVADAWLKKISQIVGCEHQNILTIPGNHDVDRNYTKGLLKNIHDQFRSLKARKEIDPSLHKILETDSECEFFLRPFDNYHKFAAKYGSIPSNGNSLYWEKNFELNDHKVRIRGVNSALISNEHDDEHVAKLFLGSHQSNIKRELGVIYIFMCHHPPQWLYDQDDMGVEVQAKTAIQLYGHKHKVGASRVNNCLVLSAGAMQPSRNEDDWQPCYNIIEVDTAVEHGKDVVLVKVWNRVLDKDNTLKFIPKFTHEGSEFAVYKLPLDGTGNSSQKRKDQTSEISKPKPKPMEVIDEEIELIDVNRPDPVRKLAYLFLSLPYHKMLKIAVELDLYEESDQNLSDLQKSQLYFKRAKDANKLRELWDVTVNSNDDEIELPNPF